MGEIPPILNINQTKYHGVCPDLKKGVLAKLQKNSYHSSINFFDTQNFLPKKKEEIEPAKLFSTTVRGRTYNTQSIYDAFGVINQEEIDLISELLIQLPPVAFFAPPRLLNLLGKDFKNRLLSVGISASFNCIHELDDILITENEPYPVLFFLNINTKKVCCSSSWGIINKNNIKTIFIGEKIQNNAEFDICVNTCIPTINNFNEFDKTRVLLNCLYLNLLSKRLINQQNFT